jgi:aminoacylase
MTINLLQEYLAINTAYPNPHYKAVIELFKRHALKDGFEVIELTLPSGNPVLVITLKGSSQELPSLALNHHMDVVPADNPDVWKFTPFAGTIHEGIMYGRGVQDCKGLGVVHYGALRQLKQQGFQPQRTIHLLLVPDEERGGFFGAKQFIEHPLFESLNIGYLLDEGLPSGNEKELLIKVDERTPIQIRVTSLGVQSHASGLLHQNCIHELTRFLANIAVFQQEQQQLSNIEQAGNCISMHVTSLATDNSVVNIIPSKAQATIDIRIPSRLLMEDGIALLNEIIGKYKSVSYEILATSKERVTAISTDSIFYQVLAQTIIEQGLTPKPFTFEATTDARFYSSRGIETMGFTPFTGKPNLHGIDESITINELLQGISLLQAFLRTFCIVKNELKENR